MGKFSRIFKGIVSRDLHIYFLVSIDRSEVPTPTNGVRLRLKIQNSRFLRLGVVSLPWVELGIRLSSATYWEPTTALMHMPHMPMETVPVRGSLQPRTWCPDPQQCLSSLGFLFIERYPKAGENGTKFNRFCYVVFNSQMFNATEVQLWKWCFHVKLLLFMRPIHVWRSRTPDGFPCVHFPSVITTIMDQKVQLLNPLN
jgi:hypothetical protein